MSQSGNQHRSIVIPKGTVCQDQITVVQIPITEPSDNKPLRVVNRKQNLPLNFRPSDTQEFKSSNETSFLRRKEGSPILASNQPYKPPDVYVTQDSSNYEQSYVGDANLIPGIGGTAFDRDRDGMYNKITVPVKTPWPNLPVNYYPERPSGFSPRSHSSMKENQNIYMDNADDISAIEDTTFSDPFGYSSDQQDTTTSLLCKCSDAASCKVSQLTEEGNTEGLLCKCSDQAPCRVSEVEDTTLTQYDDPFHQNDADLICLCSDAALCQVTPQEDDDNNDALLCMCSDNAPCRAPQGDDQNEVTVYSTDQDLQGLLCMCSEAAVCRISLENDDDDENNDNNNDERPICMCSDSSPCKVPKNEELEYAENLISYCSDQAEEEKDDYLDLIAYCSDQAEEEEYNDDGQNCACDVTAPCKSSTNDQFINNDDPNVYLLESSLIEDPTSQYRPCPSKSYAMATFNSGTRSQLSSNPLSNDSRGGINGTFNRSVPAPPSNGNVNGAPTNSSNYFPCPSNTSPNKTLNGNGGGVNATFTNGVANSTFNGSATFERSKNCPCPLDKSQQNGVGTNGSRVSFADEEPRSVICPSYLDSINEEEQEEEDAVDDIPKSNCKITEMRFRHYSQIDDGPIESRAFNFADPQGTGVSEMVFNQMARSTLDEPQQENFDEVQEDLYQPSTCTDQEDLYNQQYYRDAIQGDNKNCEC